MSDDNKINRIIIVVILSMVAPILLIPLENFFQYPYILEELAKAIIISLLLKLRLKIEVLLTILVGTLFGVSENMLYLGYLVSTGSMQILLYRMVFTLPLHIATCLIILAPTLKNKKFMPIGLFLAILIHYLFNLFLIKQTIFV